MDRGLLPPPLGRQSPAKGLGQWLGEVGSTPPCERGHQARGRTAPGREGAPLPGAGAQAGRELLRLALASCTLCEYADLDRLHRGLDGTRNQPSH